MALLAGDVQLMYNNVATALEHVALGQDGRGRGRRSPAPAGAARYSAIAETVPGFEFAAWVGIFAPAGTEGHRRPDEPGNCGVSERPGGDEDFRGAADVASYRDPEDFARYIRRSWTSGRA